MLNIEIKTLGISDLKDFRTIRLSALEKSPKMFGSTYTAEVVKPLMFFDACLSNSTVFGVYHKNEIIGLATLTQEIGAKFSHKALIYAELSGDFPLGDSRQPTYKSLRPFDLVS